MNKRAMKVLYAAGGLFALVSACDSSSGTTVGTNGISDAGKGAPTDAGRSEASSPDEGGTCSPTLLGTGPGKFSLGTPECNACVGTNCCEPFNTCYPASGGTPAQMECFQLYACVRGCFVPPTDGGASDAGDSGASDTDAGQREAGASDGGDGGGGGGPGACVGACQAKYPAGAPLFGAVFACASAHCADAGSRTCPGF